MLHPDLFRKEPDKIKESEKKRFKDTNLVDKVIEFDSQWRKKEQEREGDRNWGSDIWGFNSISKFVYMEYRY